jgi:tetratricopeptide (TPR) repeat protein
MGIEFIPAVCPKCGGELRVPSNLQTSKCTYCGMDILINNPNVIAVNNGFNVHNFEILANSALSVTNYQEAYRCFLRIIENDPTNYEGWVGKGFAAGMLSTFANPRHSEAEEGLWDKGIYRENDSGRVETHIVKLDRDTRNTIANYYEELANHFNKISHINTDYYKIDNPYLERSIGLVHISLNYLLKAALIRYCQNEVEFSENKQRIQKKRILLNANNLVNLMRFFYHPNIWVIYPRKTYFDYADFFLQENKFFSDDDFKKSFEAIFMQEKEFNGIQKNLNNAEKKSENKDKCFIATATFGDINHPDVIKLRKFRDEYLYANWIGKRFVEVYYLFSPPISKIIENSLLVRKISYIFIVRFLVKVVRYISPID